MSNKVHIYNVSGEKKTETLELSFLPKKVKPSLLYFMSVNFLANKRTGSANSKTRSEVRGGGKKPWAQKGTGRARAGSLRSPLFKGGGVIFGPKPKTYGGKVNKKVKKEALKSALLDKKSKIFVIDDLKVKEGKTKEVLAFLKKFKVTSALIVCEKASDKLVRAANNIKGVKVVSGLGQLNVYELVKYDSLFIDLNAGKKLVEVLK
jgi:large subunit ribosomal protein L4